MINIRSITTNDTENLFDIRCSVKENHLSREELAKMGITPDSIDEMIESGEYVCLIAEIEGKAAGFSMAEIAEGYLFALFVRPDAENRGVGSLLLKETERLLAAKGVEKASLATEADDTLRAVGFYRKMGWQITGKYPDGQYRFEKSLTTVP